MAALGPYPVLTTVTQTGGGAPWGRVGELWAQHCLCSPLSFRGISLTAQLAPVDVWVWTQVGPIRLRCCGHCNWSPPPGVDEGEERVRWRIRGYKHQEGSPSDCALHVLWTQPSEIQGQAGWDKAGSVIDGGVSKGGPQAQHSLCAGHVQFHWSLWLISRKLMGRGWKSHDCRGRNSWFQNVALPISSSIYFNTGLSFLIYERIVGRMNE